MGEVENWERQFVKKCIDINLRLSQKLQDFLKNKVYFHLPSAFLSLVLVLHNLLFSGGKLKITCNHVSQILAFKKNIEGIMIHIYKVRKYHCDKAA